MEYAVSLFWIGIELLSLYFLSRSFLVEYTGRKKSFLFFTLCWIVVFTVNILKIPVLEQYGFLRKLLSLGSCALVLFFCFRPKWYENLLLVSLFFFMLAAIDTAMVFVASFPLGLSVSELFWKKWLYVMVVTVGKCLILLLFFLLEQHRNRQTLQRIPGKSILRMTVFPVASVLMLYFIYENYKTQEDLSASTVIFTLVLVVANAAVLVTLRNMERNARTEQELALLHQSMALQRDNIHSLEQSYRAQRSATHEYNHQLQTLSDLLEREEISAAKAYLSELQKKQSERIFAVNTHHPIVDVVLNEKYRIAEEKGIDVHFRVNDLSSLALPTDALVVLLSNLLDNAIEACEKVSGERRIDCSLLLEECLYLSVRNSSLPVTFRKEGIATTKTPASEHGFGLPAIRRILKEWNAETAMQYQDGCFSFVAEIPVSC